MSISLSSLFCRVDAVRASRAYAQRFPSTLPPHQVFRLTAGTVTVSERVDHTAESMANKDYCLMLSGALSVFEMAQPTSARTVILCRTVKAAIEVARFYGLPKILYLDYHLLDGTAMKFAHWLAATASARQPSLVDFATIGEHPARYKVAKYINSLNESISFGKFK